MFRFMDGDNNFRVFVLQVLIPQTAWVKSYIFKITPSTCLTLIVTITMATVQGAFIGESTRRFAGVFQGCSKGFQRELGGLSAGLKRSQRTSGGYMGPQGCFKGHQGVPAEF